MQVNDCWAGKDDDRIIGKSGGESEGGSGCLVGVCIGTALLPCVLLSLASGRVLAMIGLFLLLASLLLLLLLLQPIPPLLLLWLLWSLLLLLEMEIPRIALNCTNIVLMVMQLLLTRLVLLPSNECHSLNISEGGKGVFLLLLLLGFHRGGHYLDGHTHIEYLCEHIHVP